MSDAIIIALIVAVPPTLAAAASLIVSLRNSAKLNTIEITFNSKMDAYIALAKQSAKAEGVLEEKNRDKK
jgi:hypothetical protein